MRFCNKFLGLFSCIQGRRRWSKEEIDCALESLKSSGVIEKCFTLPVLFWYWLVSKLFYNLDQVFSETAGFFSSNFLCFLVRSYSNYNIYIISLFLIPRDSFFAVSCYRLQNISGAGKDQVQVHICVYFYQIQKANRFS